MGNNSNNENACNRMKVANGMKKKVACGQLQITRSKQRYHLMDMKLGSLLE